MSDLVFRLPPYRIEALITACAETVDWGLKQCSVPRVWARTEGQGAKVAILDTGAALKHPDLRDNIAEAKDFSASQSGPVDVQGHGTHTAGIVAAARTGAGVIGTAPQAKLYIGKVLGDDGTGTAATIVNGIDWAIDCGVDVISLSLAAPKQDRRLRAAVLRAVEAGIFIVAAAGNEGPDTNTVGYPARMLECISVAAVGPGLQVAKFSSRGKRVDVAAPGIDILSCYPPRGYGRLSGTSMAAPLVAGVVALLVAWQKENSTIVVQTPAQLREAIRSTSTDLGDPGHDLETGWGLLNPDLLVPGANRLPSDLVLTGDDLTLPGKVRVRSAFPDGEGLIRVVLGSRGGA